MIIIVSSYYYLLYSLLMKIIKNPYIIRHLS